MIDLEMFEVFEDTSLISCMNNVLDISWFENLETLNVEFLIFGDNCILPAIENIKDIHKLKM